MMDQDKTTHDKPYSDAADYLEGKPPAPPYTKDHPQSAQGARYEYGLKQDDPEDQGAEYMTGKPPHKS